LRGRFWGLTSRLPRALPLKPHPGLFKVAKLKSSSLLQIDRSKVTTQHYPAC
jgi:hypothetical protein